MDILMPDRLQELAKQMAGSPANAPAPVQHSDADVDLWGAGNANSSETQGPAIDKALQYTPHSSDQGIWGNVKTGLSNIGAAGLHTLTHPEKLVTGAVMQSPPVQAFTAGRDFVKHLQGKPNAEDERMAHPVQSLLQAGEGAIGSAGALGMADTVPELRSDPLKAYRSPFIPVEEAQARAITDKLGVAPAAYPQTLESIQSNLGNLKQAGQAVGGRFKTPLEFGKTAEAAGMPAHDFFREQLIEPNGEAMTPYGSIKDVYKEISDNNKLIGPAYRKGLPSQTESLLERKQMADLTERNKMLTNAMYDELSARSGQPVDEIRRMNIQGAGLRDVGAEADAAQVLRGQGFRQPGIPFSRTEAIGRFVNKLRGGPERVAGRQISRVMEGVNQPPTPLPSAEGVNAYRGMAEQADLGNLRRVMQGQEANQAASVARKPAGMGPTEPPQAQIIEPPANYTGSVVEGAKRRSVSEPVPKPNPIDRFLGAAREGQEQARTLRRNK